MTTPSNQFQKTDAVHSVTDGSIMPSEQRFWHSFKSVSCPAHVGAISAMAFSPISPYDLVLASSTRLHLYEGRSGRPLKNITKFKDVVVSCRYRHDGQLIAAGTKDRRLKVFDVASRVLLKEFRGHTDAVRACRFASESLIQLGSGSDDGAVRLWDLPTGTCVQTFAGHDDQVRALDQIAASVWVSASFDHTVRIWDGRAGPDPIRAPLRLSGPGADLCVLRAGALLAVAGQHGLDVVDLVAGGVLHHVPVPVTCLGVHDAQRALIAGSGDQQLYFYDQDTFQLRSQLGLSAPIVSVAVRDDALAVGMADGQLSLRLRRTGSVPAALAPANPATKRYFMRGARSSAAGAADDDYRITFASGSGGAHLQPHDLHLKRYEFGAALDAALQTGNPPVILGLLHELRARQALPAALAGRQDVQVRNLLKFLVRHITDPASCDLLQEVADVLLDVYADVLGQSALTAPVVDQLLDTVQGQVGLRPRMMQLTGQIQLLSSAAI